MKKADIAFKELEAEILKAIKKDPEDTKRLQEILSKAKERMVQDD